LALGAYLARILTLQEQAVDLAGRAMAAFRRRAAAPARTGYAWPPEEASPPPVASVHRLQRGLAVTAIGTIGTRRRGQ
jgi:hypothetical protein